MASAADPALLTRFLTFINPRHPVDHRSGVPNPLVNPTDGLLLAVSGGLDSVVMAHLVQRAGYRFAIAHVNFGLRGDESDADALFVNDLANTYGVPFHLTRFQTDQFADQTGVSVQMAARTLRYEWFEQIRFQYQYDYIATAHHRNDVLETLLLNLTRGTGLAGLHGIAARQGRIIRPLLFADRADLEAYAHEQHLRWREDQSNAEDYYARNQLRHRVVPVLQALNPGLLQTLNATLERLRAAETLVQDELRRTADTVLKTTGEVTQIDLNSLRKLAEPIFRLAHWLRPFGFTYQQTTGIWRAIGQGRGQEFCSATHRLIHEREQLTVSVREPTDGPVFSPIGLDTLPDQPVFLSATHRLTFRHFVKPADFVPATDPLTASFDADRLTWPLTIRRWQSGDRFRPLGLNGHKLVSDLLTDQKVLRLDREQTLVLLAGDRIAWVIGRRLDHRFRVTTQTQRVLQVQQTKIPPSASTN